MKKLLCLVLAVLLLCGQAPARAEGPYIAAEHAKNNGSPYYIMVNRQANTVTVYELDDEGYYTRPVKAMVCSTGRKGHATPLGTYSTSGRYEWLYMVDGTFGQFATRFNGKILFHSICYSRQNPAFMLTKEYNLLGDHASLGCVRLQTGDAKWIYDNCPAKTRVTVYESEDPGPLGKPGKLVAEITAELDNGWDPTDPREENPWNALLVRELSLEPALTMQTGESLRLAPRLAPEGASVPALCWQTDEPSVASIDANGRLIAQKEGTAVITAICGDLRSSCTVTVEGEALPFDDVPAGSWYYGDVRAACKSGALKGTGEHTFSPELALSGAMALQLICNLSGDEIPASAAGEPWYAGALRWAAAHNIAEKDDMAWEDPITRQSFALMLYRLETLVLGKEAPADTALDAFSDASTVSQEAESAVRWAVQSKLLQGAGGALLPNDPLTRAQAAAILRRFAALS